MAVPDLSPPATSPAVRARMSRQRQAGTAPETALRRELHRRGLRFRVQVRPGPLGGSRRRVDVVFGLLRVAVDVRGCYRHGCPEHFRGTAANAGWWARKINRNRERDADTEALLTAGGCPDGGRERQIFFPETA